MLEIVLGIDNIIFLTILVAKVPKRLQHRTRLFGLGLAMVTRIMLLLSISWVMRLTEPLFAVVAHGFGFHMPKEYLYSAMGFSLTVELLNIRSRGKALRHAKKCTQNQV